jgi:hypothetical protein
VVCADGFTVHWALAAKASNAIAYVSRKFFMCVWFLNIVAALNINQLAQQAIPIKNGTTKQGLSLAEVMP